MKRNRIKIKCDFCGKPTEVMPYQLKIGKYHFCSRVCKGKFHSLAMRGSKNSNYRNAVDIYKCAFCGKDVKDYKNCARKKKLHFCNRDCKKKYDSKVKLINKHLRSLKIVCKTPSCNNLISIMNKTGFCLSCSLKFSYKNNPLLREQASKIATERFLREGLQHPFKKERAVRQEVKCDYCGKIFLRLPRRISKHNFCNRECFSKFLSINMSGEKNPFYGKKHSKKFRVAQSLRMGSSGVPYKFAVYPYEFNNNLKGKIRKRDSYTCQICGITEEEHIIVFGSLLHVHHIDYIKKNCNEENLISLCKSCHTRTNYNRDYWLDYFKIKIVK